MLLEPLHDLTVEHLDVVLRLVARPDFMQVFVRIETKIRNVVRQASAARHDAPGFNVGAIGKELDSVFNQNDATAVSRRVDAEFMLRPKALVADDKNLVRLRRGEF